MKKTMCLISFLAFLILSTNIYSIKKKDLEKVTAIIEKVDKFYKKYPKIKGYFSLNSDGRTKKGYFLFEAPSKLKLFFGPEYAQEPEKFKYIITNGDVLWIYIPRYKVLVEQEIPEYFKQIGMLGMGISRFLASYDKLSLKEEYVNRQKLIKLTLKIPKKNVPYKELSFYINSEGFITTMKGLTIKNKRTNWVTFSRYKLNKNPKITEKDFRIKPSGDIQILRNVLIKTK